MVESTSAQEEKSAHQAAEDLSKELDIHVDPAFGHPGFGEPMCWYLRAWCDDETILPAKWQEMIVKRRSTRR